MGSVQMPGFLNNSTIFSSGISRRIIEQQGAVNMMSTASMIPKKIQLSLSRAKEQQDQAMPPNETLTQPLSQAKEQRDQAMPQHQTLMQPHAQNLHHRHLQQSQSQHQQVNSQSLKSESTSLNNALQGSTPTDEVIPLCDWIEKESGGDCQPDNVQKQRGMMLRRTTIAYGMIELIKGARTSSHSSTCDELQIACTLDNFLVRVSKSEQESKNDDNADHHVAGKIKGVQMINPPSMLLFHTSSVSAGEELSEVDGDAMGQFIEVEIFPRPLANQAINPLEKLVKEKTLIHSVGSLIHKLYTEGNPILLLYEFQKGSGASPIDDSGTAEPPMKRIKEDPQNLAGASHQSLLPLSQRENRKNVSACTADQKASHLPLLELGFSSSTSTLVDELLDCRCTLDVASKDLHLILLDPESFLVDRYFKPINGKVSLRLRKEKLYGRDSERSLITSTFCRVKTSGKSEALLIGGYSGSGKTRLVENVLKYIDGVSCHVISLKSDESSIPAITQALDQLCACIKKSCSEDEFKRINSRLVEAFGPDFSILEKVLPNIKLFNDTKRAEPVAPKHQGSEIQSNSVSYILRLFMRAVSSQERPVLLFMDDLQWCDETSLEIVHDILSDKKDSSCVYFIGCFRDNEIVTEHPIYKLMGNMNMNNIPVQLLGLGGVNRNEMNCMTSDALCTLPRHCKDLSDIIHTKTKGDPYFALEMLSALVDRGLLQFNFAKRRWVWNQTNIMYLDVTSNVLHLLKSKMMSMPKQTQTALKVCSCFGSGVDTLIVRCLSGSAEYSSLRDELDRAVKEGFMEKVGECYKFVHDRVKVAAYGLIEVKDRNGYHHRVGMALLASSNVDDSLVSVMIDQINHGVGESIQSEKDRVAIAELNYKAGVTAMAHSGFVKAFSYFETAKLLLPENHWASHYYFSIRLFLSMSNAAFACGYGNMADEALDAILREGKCLEDKLVSIRILVLHMSSFLSNTDTTLSAPGCILLYE